MTDPEREIATYIASKLLADAIRVAEDNQGEAALAGDVGLAAYWLKARVDLREMQMRLLV